MKVVLSKVVETCVLGANTVRVPNCVDSTLSLVMIDWRILIPEFRVTLSQRIESSTTTPD